MQQALNQGKLWVVKIGTSTLVAEDGFFSVSRLEKIVSQITYLMVRGLKVILVSSGAIALGMETLEIEKRPKKLAELQACAAIGQGKLMKAYETAFSENGFHAAQVLLTRDCFQDRTRYLNAKHTMETLLEMGAVPVVNENDTIATEEIKFGDNDTLSAQVASLVGANQLIFLSDIEGFYSEDKTLIRRIASLAEIKEYRKFIYSKQNEKTAGGMKAKLDAAQISMKAGIPIVLTNGQDDEALKRVLKGEEVGSLFCAGNKKTSARKRWLAYSAKVKGVLVVDKGAYRALAELKKSLLPGGILSLSGDFASGDLVQLADEDGAVFARGLVNYSSDELLKIKGKKTGEIVSVLGKKRCDEVIHRDNLAFLE
jgi:glutamate 5-kinase